jgi:4-hydroxybenzoate polyprenyltransferase
VAGVEGLSERGFEILKMDYEMAREDERTFSNIQAATAGIVVALLAALATVLTQTCQLNPSQGCQRVPNLLLVASPSIPYAALALLQLLGTVAALRSYYIRAVETELRRQAPVVLGELAALAPISSPSYVGLVTEATTMRRGRSRYRLLSLLVLLITLSIFSGLTAYIAVRLGGWTGTAMLIGYGWGFVLLVTDVAGATLGARSTFLRIAGQFADRQGTGLLAGAGLGDARQRGLVSYLVLPRPEDWVKWLLVPLAYLVATLDRGVPLRWGPMLLTIFVVEYLVYCARYQVNDIRGYAEDATHPEAAARLRLPYPDRASARRLNVASSFAVAVLRVATALVVAARTGTTTTTLMVIGVVGVAGVLYEYLRSAEARPGSSRTGAAARGLWLLVGVGYALRYVVGACAAGLSPGDPTVWVGGLFCYGLGVMFVLLTWTLEATAHCRGEGPRTWYPTDRLRTKPHLLLLLDHLRGREFRVVPPPGVDLDFACGRERVLQGPAATAAPWNFAYWAASVAGAFLALRLADTSPDTGTGALVFTVSACGAAAVSLASAPLRRTLALLAGTIALLAGALLPGHPSGIFRVLACALPFAVCGGVYTSFRQQSYYELKHFLPDLVLRARALLVLAARAMVGRSTWETLSPPPPPPSP